jgi:hypothetical protein
MLFTLLPIRLGDLKKVAKVLLGWVIGGCSGCREDILGMRI